MFLPQRCIATNAVLATENIALLLLREFTSAGICLLSRCVAMNYPGFQTSHQNIKNSVLRKIPIQLNCMPF
jgi:hypothetical protein